MSKITKEYFTTGEFANLCGVNKKTLFHYDNIGLFKPKKILENVEKFGILVKQGLFNLGASDWSISLVVDGIIAGVGAVLGFVPQLIILFLCISILETTGYMSRVTFLLDKLFKKFGLSGETLVPFIVGLRM